MLCYIIPNFHEILATMDFFPPDTEGLDYYDYDAPFTDEYNIEVYPDGEITIQDAIEQAGPDANIVIYEGIYESDQTILIEGKQGLTITAEGEVWLICDDVYKNVITVSNSSDINLISLKARHDQWIPEYDCHGAVLYLEESNGIGVYDCELNGCGAMGLSAYRSRDIELDSCYLHRNSYAALYLYSVDEIYIYNCNITDNATFLSAYEVGSIDMEGNMISDNGGYR